MLCCKTLRYAVRRLYAWIRPGDTPGFDFPPLELNNRAIGQQTRKIYQKNRLTSSVDSFSFLEHEATQGNSSPGRSQCKFRTKSLAFPAARDDAYSSYQTL